MMTIDELREKHAAELAKLEKELQIAESCPVSPKRAMATSTTLPNWLLYEVETIGEALAIMNAAPIIPMYRVKTSQGYTRVQACETDNYVSGPYACKVKTSQGEGYGPYMELQWLWPMGEGHCRINRPGIYCGAAMTEIRDFRNRVTARQWKPNNRLAAIACDYIKWGTGSDTSAEFTYLFTADTFDGGTDHASAMLLQLGE